MLDNEEQVRLNPNGTGLGLKQSNDLAVLLNPSEKRGIQIRSVFGKGSEFFFFLTCQKQDDDDDDDDDRGSESDSEEIRLQIDKKESKNKGKHS